MTAIRYPFEQKPRRPGRFTTKTQGFGMAIAVYWCLQCNQHAGVDREKKGMFCVNCGSKAQRFDSTSEFKRYAHLRMLRDAGEISDLNVQVPFPVYLALVDGQAVLAKTGFKRWRTYYADFAYYEKGAWVIEEYKSSLKHQDETSKLRREAAEYVYQFVAKMVTA